MKKLATLLLISLCATVMEADVVALENRVLRMELGKSPAPFLDRLVHKASGQAVVASPAHKSLFAITLVKEDGSLTTIESTQAGESSASAKAGKVTLKYAKFPAMQLAVEVTVTCADNNPLTFWSIRVDNQTGRPIKTVRFPQVLAVPAIGEAQDDCLVLPALAGSRGTASPMSKPRFRRTSRAVGRQRTRGNGSPLPRPKSSNSNSP